MCKKRSLDEAQPETEKAESTSRPSTAQLSLQGFNSSVDIPSDANSKANFISRKRRMYSHFDDFVTYFPTRRQELHLGTEIDNNHLDMDDKMKGSCSRQGLAIFRENLLKFSRYSTLRALATIHCIAVL